MRRAMTIWLALLLATAAGAEETVRTDVLYQTSTIGALLQGVYDGVATVGDLQRHGDHGLGTINALDGELVILDGRFFTVQFDGTVRELSPDTLTPFAAVTWFAPDGEQMIAGPLSLHELQEAVEAMMTSSNVPVAVRISGRFEHVRTRSVPVQHRPYRPLAEIIPGQSVFEFNDVEGTMVGFWLPEYMSGINVPGWHLHFLTDDLSGGGHVLECTVHSVKAQINLTGTIVLDLPLTEDFLKVDLSAEGALEDVETVSANADGE